MNDSNKKNILMYMHAGSGNHGCEAIVRSLCGIVESSVDKSQDTKITVLTHNMEEDTRYGLQDICDLIATKHAESNIVTKAFFFALRKLLGNARPLMKYTYSSAGELSKYDVAISIGGDNYCYEDALFGLKNANDMFHHENISTWLVGCSIEPEILDRPDIIKDMQNYSLVVARESITYNALSKVIDESKLRLMPDPAFALSAKECELPEGFNPGHTIGINVSPMILGYEREDAPGITLENYKSLIRHILDTTDDQIALIPHVVTKHSDDRKPLNRLYEEFADYSDRLVWVEDRPAEELKYIISNCRMLVAARTHATIAAYSTCVPTLVIGYSVKSIGIATDLFGSPEHYVLPVQELIGQDDICKAYDWIQEHSAEQKAVLESTIPEYKERLARMGELIAR